MLESADRIATRVERGPSPLLFVCEHASASIPGEFRNLGLAPDLCLSHVAWDPGALDLAQSLAGRFQAPLFYAHVSRLVYDLNRPPEAPDAIPARSEVHDIPGNATLTLTERAERIDRFYLPWAARLEQTLTEDMPQVLVTIHSFTPIYRGETRHTRVGIVHDADRRLADAVLARSETAGLGFERNEPYGPQDGVTHTLKAFAEPRGVLPLMIEVRNDLIAGTEGVTEIAATIASALMPALSDVGVNMPAAQS